MPRRMIRRSLVAMLMVVMAATPAAAQTEGLPDPGMLPSNGFYSFLERSAEAIGTFFTFGNDDKAARFLSLAEERLAEALELVQQDEIDDAEEALDRYRLQLEEAMDLAEGLESQEAEEISTQIAEATLKHLAVLAGVYEQVPEEAQAGIQRAMQASSAGHDRVLEALSAVEQQDVADQAQERIEELRQKRQKGLPVPSVGSETELPVRPGPAQGRDVPASDQGQEQGQVPGEVPVDPRRAPGQAPVDTPAGQGGPPEGTGGGPDTGRP
ncbi:MAG: hypothetical protein KY393_05265 [Actinobacteria bacterium]|nr:hypothetical protein [Actinomycetota bacterium]